MVEAEHLQKTYQSNGNTVNALKDINLHIKEGEMVSIMGPSGCGKTTLLNCISGLDYVTSGTIKVEGTLLESMTDRDRTRHRAQRMGFIFQSFNLLPVLSAVENVELPLLICGVDQKEARPRALEALRVVGLDNRAHHKPAELSGGQQQRVTIARALVNNPAIVWADEPTGNLDSEGAQQVLDLIKRLNRENNQTFVIVTHDPVVGAMANRMIKMKDGQILSEHVLSHKDPPLLPDQRPMAVEDVPASRYSVSAEGQRVHDLPATPHISPSYGIDFVVKGSATAWIVNELTTIATNGYVTRLKTTHSGEGGDVHEIALTASNGNGGERQGTVDVRCRDNHHIIRFIPDKRQPCEIELTVSDASLVRSANAVTVTAVNADIKQLNTMRPGEDGDHVQEIAFTASDRVGSETHGTVAVRTEGEQYAINVSFVSSLHLNAADEDNPARVQTFDSDGAVHAAPPGL